MALREQFDPDKIRFLALDLWNGSDGQCDIFQNVSGIDWPVLLDASALGGTDQYACGVHYAFVIGGDGIVQYRGSLNFPALEIVIAEAISRLPTQVAVDDLPGTGALLGANYPNPFNPSTNVPYLVPDERAGFVQLDVVDLRGRVVRTLVAADRASGQHTALFDGRSDDGRVLPSGSYVARLRLAGMESQRVMTLVK